MLITFSLVLVLSLGVKKSVSCRLQGELCMFNLYGFGALKAADAVEVLHAEVNRSYIESVTYKENLVSSCTIEVDYIVSPGNTLLLEIMTQNASSWPIAYLSDAAAVREVVLNKTSQPFKLRLTALSNDSMLSVNINSVQFSLCNLVDKSCSIKKGVMCDGWKESHEYPEVRWTPEEGYMEIHPITDKSLSVPATWSSPQIPSITGTNCEITYQHYSVNYESDPYIQVIKYYQFTNNETVRELAKLSWNENEQRIWQTSKINIHTNDSSLRSFHISFSSHSTEHNGTTRIANVTFGDSCFHELITVDPLSSLAHSAETFSAYITTAANLSVANRSTSYWFFPCQSTGPVGPTSEQCRESYAHTNRTPYVNVTMDDLNMPGVQKWRVPKTNLYNIILYGATGGFGIETKTTPGILRGYTEYWNLATPLSIWPSRLHIRLQLVKGEQLYIIVGQAGTNACDKKNPKDCVGRDMEYGGGGGGGGASLVYLERNGTMILLAIAGGGGGMGRIDQTGPEDLEALMAVDCDNSSCPEYPIRPGIGGSLQVNPSWTPLQQDAQHLNLLCENNTSFLGGQGCEKYNKYFNTPGGFGGGGGGCTAGGGGGGYQGGSASKDDSSVSAGSQGTSFWNSRLIEYQALKQRDPFNPKYPQGFVEVTEQPPPCGCNDRPCQWLDGSYSDYQCLCNSKWVPKHHLYKCETPSILPQSSKSRPAIIIVSVTSGAIALVLSFCLVYAIRQLKKTGDYRYKHQFSENHPQLKMDVNPTYAAYDGLPDALPEERITMIRHLGEGRFSTVFEARLALTDSWNSPEMTVAIKKPKDNSPQTRAEFLQEAKTINSFNHPNIIKIIGVCELSNGIIGIAMDVLRGGDLLTFLKENRPNEQTSTPALLFGDLIKIASQIVSACKYLEESKYIHRDIAARNVLLTEKGPDRVAKISDFGLSRDIYHEDYCPSSSKPVPIKWYPPEAIIEHKHTSKSDVWSYGVLLWEIFSYGEQPYTGMDLGEVAAKVKNGYTMNPPKTCPEPIGQLMNRCWMYHPTDRPDFILVHLQLSRLLENEALMSSPIGLMKHERLPSVTSSASSGFEELPDSPSCLSMKPLLDGDCSGI